MSSLEKFKIIRDIEQGMFDNRPCFKTVLDGTWVWRFANGFTGRANSLQCLDIEDDRNFKARLNRHWRRSLEHGIKPIFRVTPLTPLTVVEFLLADGFEREGNSLVMALAQDAFENVALCGCQIRAQSVLEVQWQDEISRLEGYKGPDGQTFIRLLKKLPLSSVGMTLLNKQGDVVGAAYGSYSNALGSLFALVVDPKYRGNGFGKILSGQIFAWLIAHGAQTFALQVVGDNAPAVGLYKGFGFKEMYKYYYLMGK